MRETLEQMVARINAGAFIPPATSTKGESKMAKPVKLAKNKEFHFKAANGAAASKYPWDEWFKGDLLMLERSEMKKDDSGVEILADEKPIVETRKDYDVENDAMPAKIKTAARRRYKVVQISRLDADGERLVDALIIKARPMDDAERTAEDIKRAEEKAAKEAADDAEVPAQPDAVAAAS